MNCFLVTSRRLQGLSCCEQKQEQRVGCPRSSYFTLHKFQGKEGLIAPCGNMRDTQCLILRGARQEP
eukprot:678167-Pelagomonas_calceolata.AAC.9